MTIDEVTTTTKPYNSPQAKQFRKQQKKLARLRKEKEQVKAAEQNLKKQRQDVQQAAAS